MMSHFQLMTSLLPLIFLMYLLKVSVTASSTVTVVNIFAIFWFLLSNFPHFHWIWSVIVQVLTKVGYVSDFYVVTFYSLSSFSYFYIFLCCLVILVKIYHWSSCHLIIFMLPNLSIFHVLKCLRRRCFCQWFFLFILMTLP